MSRETENKPVQEALSLMMAALVLLDEPEYGSAAASLDHAIEKLKVQLGAGDIGSSESKTQN